MLRRSMRVTLVVLAVAVASLATVTLFAVPADLQQQPALDVMQTRPAPWLSCPVPSCAAPCVYPPPPQVLCKAPGGPAFVTSYACCCCRSSAGVKYRPL